MLDRRRFLRVSTVAASGGLVGCASPVGRGTPTASSSPRPARLGQGSPRRIIHLVSDGMSLGTLSCADQLHRFETGRGLAWLDLWNRPEAQRGLMDMRSLDSLVTDSAAASSSWGCGSRVRNGVLNVDSKGHSLRPLMALFGEAGWKRGLVTTTEITHATPAGFSVCVDDRGKGEEIALRYLDLALDVYLGGAQNHFDPAKRKDKRDVWEDFRKAGYVVALDRTALMQAPTDRPWLGTFAAGHLPYSLDQRHDASLQRSVPTIAAMTERALDHLGRHDHFLLQIEGGRVDHACHNNDAAAALRDQLALDAALQVVLDFQRRHPETLVVVTTDHGNANLGLNGMGSSYRDSSERFRRVAEIKASFPEILKQLKELDSDTAIADVLGEMTGLRVAADKLETFRPYVKGKGHALFDQMNSDVAALGQLLANHLGIGFTGTTHTSDYVPIVAIGPGAERFCGMVQNTDVFRHYTSMAGIDYRNPEEPLLADTADPASIPSPAPRENIAEYAIA